MILQHRPDGIIAIKQQDHAAFAAFLLEHWAGHNFAHDPEREAILLATREHDNGWRVWDAAPRLDEATGLPVNLTHVTPEESLAIWRRGTATFLESDPFVALLITHHGYSIHEIAHKRQPEWKDFFTEFAQLRAELRTRLGLEHPQVERAYSYLRMADWFSLMYCLHHDLGAERPEQYGGYQFRRVAEELQFKPYPFDTRRLEYRLPVYPLRPEGYPDLGALRADLITPVMQSVTIVPMGRVR